MKKKSQKSYSTMDSAHNSMILFAGKKKYSRDWDFEESNLKRYLEGKKKKNKISIWDIRSFSLQHSELDSNLLRPWKEKI
ncbi:hypothetical protein F2P79_024768 [Pimephales promelas]|nr:hypothetical protein F2P79_024768 [Pimephales promelas]